MNPQENIVINSENDTFRDVSISDLESQIVDNLIHKNEESQFAPLKSILKRDTQSSIESEEAEIAFLKIISAVCIIIIASPIIIADLYFGFTDTSCVDIVPDGLYISMKLYLLVSGFVGLFIMILYVASIISLSTENNDSNAISVFCVYFIGTISIVFNMIWNILGAIVFWGTIYREKTCNKNVSTYIFVSLIIKFIGSLGALNSKKSDKE